MLRILMPASLLIALLSAYALYAINQDVRRLAADVAAKERMAERLAADIGLLTAERAYLARPERIEALARSLGLAPATVEQLRTGMARPQP
jgi:cell division protein FtsL